MLKSEMQFYNFKFDLKKINIAFNVRTDTSVWGKIYNSDYLHLAGPWLRTFLSTFPPFRISNKLRILITCLE